jgi:hypothetical protein
VENVEQRVRKIIAEQLGVNEGEIKNESSFVDDLGANLSCHLGVNRRDRRTTPLPAAALPRAARSRAIPRPEKLSAGQS